MNKYNRVKITKHIVYYLYIISLRIERKREKDYQNIKQKNIKNNILI